MPGLLDECIRKTDKEKAFIFACNAMQVYLISFRQKWTPAHLFPVYNLKTGQVLWCIIVFEFRTSLSELRCQWLRRYVPQCVYKNTSNSLTSTQWREAAQSHGTNKKTTALASHEERWLMWCLLCECLSVHSFNEDQYQGLHCFELSDPWRWPLHSSATDLVCGIICCSPSIHKMKRLNIRTYSKNRLVYELCVGEKQPLMRLKHGGKTTIVFLSVRADDLKLFLCEFFPIAQSPGTHATILGVKAWDLWVNVSNKTLLDNEKPHHCTALIQRPNNNNSP